jgi:FkbM family methyltransferase
MRIQDLIKRAAKKVSLDVRKYSDRNIFQKRIVKFLSDLRVDLLIDVGANRGQFGHSMYEHGYRGTIVSFEPIPDAHDQLVRLAAQSGYDWRVAPCTALTDNNGTAELTITKNSASSSLLAFTDRMTEFVPIATVKGKIIVETARLDNFLMKAGLAERSFALKIDTQGSEMAVLAGALKVEPNIHLVMLEASIAQLYQEQPSYHEIDTYLRHRGWKLIDIEPGYRHPESLALCEFDAVYAK